MKTELSVMAIVRLVIYGISALMGLSALFAMQLGSNDLATLLTSISSGLLVLVGGTAAFNLPKAPDVKDGATSQRPAGFNLDFTELVPAVVAIIAATKQYTDSQHTDRVQEQEVQPVEPGTDDVVFQTQEDEDVPHVPAPDPLAQLRDMMKG